MPTLQAILQPALLQTQPSARGFVIPDLGDLPTAGLYNEGTEASETLYGTDLDDGIYAIGGNDTVYAGSGRDLVDGGFGSDALYGGTGLDSVYGGYGNDLLVGGAGADHLDGGWNTDTASYADAATGVSLSLSSGGYTGDAAGDMFFGIENVFGSRFGDVLIGDHLDNGLDGGSGDDWLFGKDGNDRLSGGVGLDIIKGGAGHDTIIGGAGHDTLTGNGEGSSPFDSDLFVISPASGHDVITDFQVGADKIGLTNFSWELFNGDGSLARGTSVLDEEPEAGQLFYDTGNDRLLLITSFDDGGFWGPTIYEAEVLATFTNDPLLSRSDFVFA